MPYQQPRFPWNRPCPATAVEPICKKAGLKRALYPVNTQKPRPVLIPKGAFFAACTDWQCFHSLPPKIQQSCFSNEERIRLHKLCCMNEVLDAADEAFFRFETRRRMPESADTASIPQPSNRCFGISGVDPHNGMEDTLYTGFERLDEEDLDLTLDEYHAHVVDSPSSLPLERNLFPSRIQSFYPADPSFRPLSAMHHAGHSSTASKANITILTHNTETYPYRSQFHHASCSSDSSIDPPAQYYRDPEARLKLRVYLASPQKFDEAVEFGFPTLKGLVHLGREFRQPKIRDSHVGAFPEEDQAFTGGEPRKEPSTLQVSKDIWHPQSQRKALHLKDKRYQWLSSSKPNSRRYSGNREMTLKMTLTRPDLRTDLATSKSTELLPDKFDPIWDSEVNERSLLKRMWQTLRRQKYIAD